MGKSAREAMSGGAECIGEKDTVEAAAKRLADLDVGAMPICGEDDRLKGMLTDRDITIKVVRRLPVIDGHKLIGVVSQADLAKAIDSSKVGALVQAISAAP